MRAPLIVRLAAAFVALGLSVVAARSALAAAARVAVRRSVTESPDVRKAESRIADELRAAGFLVQIIAPEVPLPVADDADARTVVAVAQTEGALSADVSLVDKATSARSLRHLDAAASRPGEEAEDLALRVVELLRSNLIDLPPTPSPAPPVVAAPAPTPPPAPRMDLAMSGFGASAAGFSSYAPGGLGPTLAPLFRLSYGTRGRLRARVGLSMPTTSQDLTGSYGTARLAQKAGFADLGLIFRKGARFQPFISAGAAAFAYSTEGETGLSLFSARSASQLAFAATGSGGVFWRLGRHVAVFAEAHLLLFPRRLVVRIGGEEALDTHAPAAGLSLGVAAWSGALR